MEARARAAVARLQEVSTAQRGTGANAASAGRQPRRSAARCCSPSAPPTRPSSEAKSEADRIVDRRASRRPPATIDSTREMSARLLEDARTEARQVVRGRAQGRRRARSQALVARRDFLESDVDHLEQFLVDQRDRLRQAASRCSTCPSACPVVSAMCAGRCCRRPTIPADRRSESRDAGPRRRRTPPTIATIATADVAAARSASRRDDRRQIRDTSLPRRRDRRDAGPDDRRPTMTRIGEPGRRRRRSVEIGDDEPITSSSGRRSGRVTQ